MTEIREENKNQENEEEGKSHGRCKRAVFRLQRRGVSFCDTLLEGRSRLKHVDHRHVVSSHVTTTTTTKKPNLVYDTQSKWQLLAAGVEIPDGDANGSRTFSYTVGVGGMARNPDSDSTRWVKYSSGVACCTREKKWVSLSKGRDLRAMLDDDSHPSEFKSVADDYVLVLMKNKQMLTDRASACNHRTFVVTPQKHCKSVCHVEKLLEDHSRAVVAEEIEFLKKKKKAPKLSHRSLTFDEIFKSKQNLLLKVNI